MPIALAVSTIGKVVKTACSAFGMLHLIWTIVLNAFFVMLGIWIAADGSNVRGFIVAFWTVLVFVLAGLVMSIPYTVATTIKKTIAEADLPRRVLDGIFEIAMKSKMLAAAQERADGVTVGDVERMLKDAGKKYLEDPLAGTKVPRFASFVFCGVLRVVVWVTVRLAVRFVAKGKGKDAEVDPESIKDELVEKIDGLVEAYIDAKLKPFLAVIAGAAVVLSLLGALVVDLF